MAPAMMEKVLGLSGEAGEVADKFKKIIRDKGGDLSVEDKEAVVKELGDVLWYIAEISRYLDTPLSEVARKNLEKLYSRLDRNKIAGDGDNR
ncbi:nucleoside triphosphate pyrophosphohydrolase family protein [Candidatus Saccharibacteria bacterium]|nr:nucleoside triphosphate pyrophosphohydrolase family protein [Candidatus Saccharibacteria bacterium]